MKLETWRPKSTISLELHVLARHFVSKHPDIQPSEAHRSQSDFVTAFIDYQCIMALQSHVLRTLFFLRTRIYPYLQRHTEIVISKPSVNPDLADSGRRSLPQSVNFWVYPISVLPENREPGIFKYSEAYIGVRIVVLYPNHVSYFHSLRLDSWIWNNYRFRWSRV